MRTSVSIDPATGAAEDGALFTYEAIPRSTVLRFSIVYRDPQQYSFPVWKNGRIEPQALEKDWEWVRSNVEKGLRLMEYLGIGGMSTRGFGRLRILGLDDKGGGVK